MIRVFCFLWFVNLLLCDVEFFNQVVVAWRGNIAREKIEMKIKNERH